MIDVKKDHGKLHLILELIERRDLRRRLDEQFTLNEQQEIFQMFKSILADEIHFVMEVQEGSKQVKPNLRTH